MVGGDHHAPRVCNHRANPGPTLARPETRGPLQPSGRKSGRQRASHGPQAAPLYVQMGRGRRALDRSRTLRRRHGPKSSFPIVVNVMNPREAIARSVDWMNVRAVRARLGNRTSPHLDAGRIPAGAPTEGPHLAGRRAGREVWRAPSCDWTAERIPARTPGREPAAVILLHGWLASSVQFAFYRWLASPLGGNCDVWMPRLPEHGERTSPGAVSGELCLGQDPGLTAAQVRRAVAEVDWLARGLRASGRRVGIWGVSLGGWVASLAACDDNCDALVLWAPVLDPPRTFRESGLGGLLRERMGDHEVSSRVDDTPLARELSPEVRSVGIHGDRLLMVGGRYDDIAPPGTLESMERRSRGRLEILPHGHITLLASRRARALSLSFLGKALGRSDHY